MNVSEIEKENIWKYMISLPKKERSHGITDKHLEKVKPIIFQQDYFWDDIYWRHGLNRYSLEELKNEDKYTYDHCIGNFWGMLMEIMYRVGITNAS